MDREGAPLRRIQYSGTPRDARPSNPAWKTLVTLGTAALLTVSTANGASALSANPSSSVNDGSSSPGVGPPIGGDANTARGATTVWLVDGAVLTTETYLDPLPEIQPLVEDIASRRRWTSPHRKTVSAAENWLLEVRDRVMAAGLPWSRPAISCTPEPEVLFDWASAERDVSIYIHKGKVESLKSWGPSIRNEMESGTLDGADDILELWKWLTRAA